MAYTITRETLPVHQPLSLGNLKGFIVEIDVTSYTSPVVITPADVGLTTIAAIVPMGQSDQGGRVQQNPSHTPDTFIMVDDADDAEFTATEDAGSFKALVLGTGG